jgi:uncharacterized protein with PIN domain
MGDRRMIETTIRCDHCHAIIDDNGYRIAHLQIDPQKEFLDKELELCPKCAKELREYIMDYIQPKHYKY